MSIILLAGNPCIPASDGLGNAQELLCPRNFMWPFRTFSIEPDPSCRAGEEQVAKCSICSLPTAWFLSIGFRRKGSASH